MSTPPNPLHRVLLVEDDSMVREVIRLLLEDNYDVLESVSARAATALLLQPEAPPVEVILADCLLPDGSPATLLTMADQMGIPVVLISGDPRQAEALGPDRPFLLKPFSQRELLAALDSARG